MLTLEELSRSAINAEVAREAHAQAQKRLEDALATKASHEQKAFALLAAYVTVALTLFGVFGILRPGPFTALAQAFLYVGIAYTVGALLSAAALLPKTYGVMGSDPSAWLRKGVIDGGEGALPAALAYETFFHIDRIAESVRSNRIKRLIILAALAVGALSPVLLAVLVLATN